MFYKRLSPYVKAKTGNMFELKITRGQSINIKQFIESSEIKRSL